ncbi:MAG TPA: aminopeptidase P N-terminal domain-containing protein [Blastocatellia bacterium]|nr:aminopeptidase P N-terminal domain-containing protein [Blastocatellia bacterium]
MPSHLQVRERRNVVALVALILAALAAPCAVQQAASEGARVAGQPKTEYGARRQRLLEKVKDGIVVLIGAREEDLGEVGRFRQNNDFMYLSGVETPAAFLMIVPANLSPTKAAHEVVFIPARNPSHERWNGVQMGPGKEAEQWYGAQEVAPSDKFWDRLREAISSPAFKSTGAKLYTLVPTGEAAKLTRENEFVETVRREFPDLQVTDVRPLIWEMRKVKSSAEVELLQKAIDITSEAHRDAARAIKPGVYEYQVQAALEYAFMRNGAERPGFPSIVGSGINSTILHYNTNRRRVEAGDLIVIDIGAEYSYYTADLTRTYPASGKFTPRQREIYQLVLDAQRAAERAFKPGESTVHTLYQVAADVMRTSKLRDKQGRTLERYFIHGLSHWLGMDVHDVGEYRKIPAGAVLTIEPGIYIPEENFGVRIEDDYLATDKGLVKLSAKLPSDPDEVERMMAAGAQASTGQRR